MGNCVGGFKSRAKKTRLTFRKTRKIYLCVLGVDGAGKSTFVKAIASEDITGVLPTNGFTLSEFKYKNTEIVAYDLGGGERIRAIWKNYYPEVFGLIYVIDGSDESRLNESGDVLKGVMSDENLRGKPILVLVNKKDRPGCIDEIQLSDRFNLHDLANMYRAHIRVEVCSANQGTGNAIDGAIKDGFEWFLERIFDDFDRLEKGVNEALRILKQKQEEERIRRQHRLAATTNSTSNSDSKAGSERNSNTSNENQLNDARVQTNVDECNSQLVRKMERRNGNFRKWSRNQVVPLPQTTDGTTEEDANKELVLKRSRLPPHLPPLQLSNATQNSSNNTLFSRRASSAGTKMEPSLDSTKRRTPTQIVPLTSFPTKSSIAVKPKRSPLVRNDSA